MATPLLLDWTGKPIARATGTARLEERRAASRRLAAKYDSAQTTDENRNHFVNADGLSAAAANSAAVRQKLRNFCRYEIANNTYACGMQRTLADLVVGTGPSLQMTTGDPEADSLVEHAWWKWTLATGFAGKLRTLRMARVSDGEGFALLFTNYGLNHRVKLDLKLYEADQVARPWADLTDPLGTDGILLDDFGNPLAYTLLKHHPGDLGTLGAAGDYETVPARNMIHYFRADRPGQVRGIPEITPALPLYAQLRRYTLAVIAAAEVAADLSILLKTQATANLETAELEPLDVFDLERRAGMTLPAGWEAFQMKAEQPATTYPMFKREIIAEIARCLNLSYNIAAGDSSGYNYSSGRLDHQQTFKSIEIDRVFTEQIVLEHVFARWWEEAALVGLLPESLAEQDEPGRHEWRWDGFEHVDPQKEANAQGTRLANYTTTLARECQREGLDWEDVLRQRAKEAGLMIQLGLAGPTPAPVPEEDDEDEDEQGGSQP